MGANIFFKANIFEAGRPEIIADIYRGVQSHQKILYYIRAWHIFFKARTVEHAKQSLLANDCVTRNNEMSIKAVFSVRSVPKLCNEDQLPLQKMPW
jgi:hypothetical protein